MSLDVLVTGHSGFIGRHLCEALNARGLSWTGISRAHGFDLEQPDALQTAPAARWVVHLAGRVGVVPSWSEPEAFYRTNVLSTLTVLKYARTHQAKILYLSSYMYGIPEYQPIDEKHPVSCLNPYAQSKLAGETLCRDYAADFKVEGISLRPFSVYGTGQDKDQVVPHLISQALSGDTVTLADLKPVRDFLWVGDLAQAMLSIIAAEPKGFSIYNIGSGAGISVEDMLNAVLVQTGPRRVECRDIQRINKIPTCVCDSTAFSRDFGWRPTTSLAEGIRRMIEIERAG